MSSGRRSAIGRGLLVALLVVALAVLLLDFWLSPLSDDAALVLAVVSLIVAVVAMGVVIYRGLATGMRRSQSILREVPGESRGLLRKAWRSDAEGVPPHLAGALRRYAAAQVIACENTALVAGALSLIWASRGVESVLDAVLRGVAVCFVVLGLVSVWMAGRWRRVGSSATASA